MPGRKAVVMNRIVRLGDCVRLVTVATENPPGTITIFNIGTGVPDPGAWAIELIGKPLGSIVTLDGHALDCKIVSIARN